MHSSNRFGWFKRRQLESVKRDLPRTNEIDLATDTQLLAAAPLPHDSLAGCREPQTVIANNLVVSPHSDHNRSHAVGRGNPYSALLNLNAVLSKLYF